MRRAYSEDFLRRVVAEKGKGLSMRAVAEKYSVSLSFVSRACQVFRVTDSANAWWARGLLRSWPID